MSPKRLTRRDFLRLTALSGAGMAAASTLAACATPTPQVVKETVVVTPTPAARKEVVVWWGSGVDIELKLQQDPKNTDALWAKWLIEHFEARYPGTKVKAEDHGWDEPLRTGLLTAIAGGNAPDVTIGEAYVHEFASLGAFNPVEDVNYKDFPWGTVAGAYFEGKLYGIPAFTSSFAMEMNRTVLEKSGLNPDKPPKTWDEILANSQKVFEAGKKGADWFGFTVYGPTPTRTYGAVLRAMPWINRTGGLVGDDAGTKPMFNDSRAVAAYELLRALFKTTDPGVSLSEHEEKVGGALWENKSAYQVSATWDCYFAKQRGANTLYAPVPDCTFSGCLRSNVVLGNLTFSPLKTGRNPEMGIKWCQFLAEEESQWQIAKIRGWVLPTLLKVLKAPDLAQQKGYEGHEKEMKVHIEILLNEELHPVPPFKKNPSRIWTMWSDIFGKILLTSEPIPTLLNQMQAEAEKLLAG